MSLETLVPNLRAAFRTRLLTLTGLPTSRAWEGETFEPTDGQAYVAEAMQVASQRRMSYGANTVGDIHQHALIAAATFFYPNGKGTSAIEAIAGKCQKLFISGTSLTHGGDRATVINVSRSGLYKDGNRIACAVSVELQAFTQN